MLQELKRETLATRRKTARTSFMYKLSHNLTDFLVEAHLKPNNERRTRGSPAFNFNQDNLDDTKIMHFVDHMQKNYITHWKHSLCNSQKLEFYVFKDSYTPSTYLDVTRKIPNRKILAKLRISDHKLNTETGRYDKISRCDRICPVCGLNIEDEIHFLSKIFIT